MKEQPFYIGQKVVCVESKGAYQKGIEYVVKVIQQCSCGLWKVGCVEHNINNPINVCKCGSDGPVVRYWLANSSRFAPIQENFQAITFEKIMETALTSVN
jgi:hypothetical protein